MPSSRGSSQPRDRTQVFCIAGRFFAIWATREAQEYWSMGSLVLLQGIFPTQESNLSLMLADFQADSLAVELPGKPNVSLSPV